MNCCSFHCHYSHCEDAEGIDGQLGEVEEAVSVEAAEAAPLVLSEVPGSELVEVSSAGVSVAVDNRALALSRQTQTRALKY